MFIYFNQTRVFKNSTYLGTCLSRCVSPFFPSYLPASLPTKPPKSSKDSPNLVHIVRTIAIAKFKHNISNTCADLVLSGNQLESSNSLLEIVDILSNWKQNWMHLFFTIWFFLLISTLNLGTMQNMHYANSAIISKALQLNTCFPIKKLTFTVDLLFKKFLMPHILQTLLHLLNSPNLLLWITFLLWIHFTLYSAFLSSLGFA